MLFAHRAVCTVVYCDTGIVYSKQESGNVKTATRPNSRCVTCIKLCTYQHICADRRGRTGRETWSRAELQESMILKMRRLRNSQKKYENWTSRVHPRAFPFFLSAKALSVCHSERRQGGEAAELLIGDQRSCLLALHSCQMEKKLFGRLFR